MIIGRAFMHELNVPFPLSLTRFFLTQQLIYKNKIEKHNISLDIFVSDTNIARLPETFIYLEKENFSYIRTHTPFFRSDFGICVSQKQGTFEDQDLIIIEVKKKYLH